MKIVEYERCIRCGRKLKTPESRKIGMGKICLQKSKPINKVNLHSLFDIK